MIKDQEAYDRMVIMGLATQDDIAAEPPLHFELCAYQANPNWHDGHMPAIVLASTDEEPLGKGHGYLSEQMIRRPEDLERFIAYLRDLGGRTFGKMVRTPEDLKRFWKYP